MNNGQLATKVVIEQRALRGSGQNDSLQKVATVYIDGDECRVLAPPRAVGDPLEWLDHLSVRRPSTESFGSEIEVVGSYSVLAVKLLEEELERLRRGENTLVAAELDGLYYHARLHTSSCARIVRSRNLAEEECAEVTARCESLRRSTSMKQLRMTSELSESLHQRLNSYALAASAAGVGVLALANVAEAKIVYTKAHVNIAPPNTAPLDLNHDGKTDFLLKDTYFTFLGGANALLSVAPARRANQIAGYTRGVGHYASALASGVPISSKAPFGTGAEVMARAVFTGITGACYGAWANVQSRYLGLRFSIKGKIHYGWARLNVSCPSKVISATLTGYAYETVPNKPIIAGKTKGPDVITLKPATLGHLARGASAMNHRNK